MTTTRVYVFSGLKKQIPQSFDVTGDTYQDIVNIIINNGGGQGEILDVNGNTVDYKSPIFLKEVNYIIPEDKNVIKIITETLEPKKTQIDIHVPGRGTIGVDIIPGVTRSNDIVEEMGETINNMRLAKLSVGDFSPFIYNEKEEVGAPGIGEALFLVPNYETLLNIYAKSL